MNEFDEKLGQELVDKGILSSERLAELASQLDQAHARGETVSLVEILAREGLLQAPSKQKTTAFDQSILEDAAEGTEEEPPTQIEERPSVPPTSAWKVADSEEGTEPGYRLLQALSGRSACKAYRAARDGAPGDFVIRMLPSNGSSVSEDEITEQLLTASALEHPGIAAPLEVVHLEQGIGMVFPFIEGVSLHQVLAKKGPLTEIQAVEIVGQVARAMEAAWKQDITHGGMTPRNLVLTANGQLCVLGYGLVRSEFSLNYGSLEQRKGGAKLDIRADIYSLGVIFYEMLAGRRPFEGDGKAELTRLHFQKLPEDIRQWNSEVSLETWRVVRKLLAKGRRDRYQTPLDLLQDLDALINLVHEREAQASSAPAAPPLAQPAVEKADPEMTHIESRPLLPEEPLDDTEDTPVADWNEMPAQEPSRAPAKEEEEFLETIESAAAAAYAPSQARAEMEGNTGTPAYSAPPPGSQIPPESKAPPPDFAARSGSRITFTTILPLIAAVFILLAAYYYRQMRNSNAPVASAPTASRRAQPKYTREQIEAFRQLKDTLRKKSSLKKVIARYFAAAEKFTQEFPNRFSAARDVYETIMKKAEGSEIEEEVRKKCQAAIADLDKKEQGQTETVLAEANSAAEKLFAEGHFAAAIERYEDIPDSARSATVESAILLATEKMQRRAKATWEKAKAAVNEIAHVVPKPPGMEEANTSATAEKNGPAAENRKADDASAAASLSKAEELELESAPSTAEIEDLKELIEPFTESGIQEMAMEARDLLGALDSLQSKVIFYEQQKHTVIEAKARKSSQQLFDQLAGKVRPLLAKYKSAEALKLCEAALADKNYSYHYESIRQLANEARALEEVVLWAKGNADSLKGRFVQLGRLRARFLGMKGEKIEVQSGMLRYEKDFAELEPKVIFQLAASSDGGGDKGVFHRSLAVFAFHLKDFERASQEFEAARAAGADLGPFRGTATQVEIAARGRKEQAQIEAEFTVAKKQFKKKLWAELRKQIRKIRLSYGGSEPFKKIQDQLYDWDDLIFEKLDAPRESVAIPAGAYKNIFDEPVQVKAFKIDRYEVTNSKYARFLRYIKRHGDAKFAHPMEKGLVGQDGKLYARPEDMKRAGAKPGGKKDRTPLGFENYVAGWEDLPVVNIDWFDAYAYARWRGKRLPTLKEFTRAFCGNGNPTYPWGKEWRPEYCNANDGGAADGSIDGFRGLAPVGSFEKGKSIFGVFNLAGNAREFVAEERGRRQTFGGSFRDSRSMCSFEGISRLRRITQRSAFIGFRCAEDVK